MANARGLTITDTLADQVNAALWHASTHQVSHHEPNAYEITFSSDELTRFRLKAQVKTCRG